MKKIITIIGGIVILGALIYQAYFIYQLKKESDLTYQVLNTMGTPDKDGITGFDKLVVQTINKLNQNGKK